MASFSYVLVQYQDDTKEVDIKIHGAFASLEAAKEAARKVVMERASEDELHVKESVQSETEYVQCHDTVVEYTIVDDDGSKLWCDVYAVVKVPEAKEARKAQRQAKLDGQEAAASAKAVEAAAKAAGVKRKAVEAPSKKKAAKKKA